MSLRSPSSTPPGETGGPPAEPPYPWRLFVGMLVAILIGGAVLAVALGLNPLTFQKFAPAAQSTPIATATAVSAPTTAVVAGAPAIAPTAVPAVGPTAVPTPAPTPAMGAVPVAAQTAIPFATVVAPGRPATTGATTGAVVQPTVAATAEATNLPTSQAEPTPVQPAVSPELATAIIQGYDKYWLVRVRASGNPNDTTLDLESVMAEGELQAAYKTLDQYRQEGIAFHTTVDHQIWITSATPTEATVVDRYRGQSVKLNLDTGQPESSDPVTESFADAFFLKNVDGVWKVVGEQPWE